ncbi:MAG: CHRD domain-containing protein [Planctomycetota bacterium]
MLAARARAQVEFRATLDGQNEVPPVTTKAGAWATFTLNADKTLTYFLNNQGLSATAAHIHEGPPGVDGGIVFPLSGGPDVFAGATPALTDAQIATLRDSGYYVNVHTAANPDGEIRGQIEVRPVLFGAHLVGSQVVPPVSTNATGDADFTVNGDRTITYNVTLTGASGTAASIHTGALGQNGPVLFTLSGGPTSWTGTTGALTTADFTSLQQLGLYVEIDTSANPTGEVRGQIVSSFAKYGPGCASSNKDVPALFGLGAPTPGGTIVIKVNHALASGVGIFVESLSADAVSVSGCGYYLGLPMQFVIVQLDANGEIKLTVTKLPDLPSFDLFVQFFGLDPGAPNGAFYAANALHMPYTKL